MRPYGRRGSRFGNVFQIKYNGVGVCDVLSSGVRQKFETGLVQVFGRFPFGEDVVRYFTSSAGGKLINGWDERFVLRLNETSPRSWMVEIRCDEVQDIGWVQLRWCGMIKKPLECYSKLPP